MPASAYGRLPLNALRVFEAVATRLSFSEAAEALNVTPAAVSQHLAKLRLARIVTTRHEGNRVFYRLANEHPLELVTDAMFQAEHSLDDQPRHHNRTRQEGDR